MASMENATGGPQPSSSANLISAGAMAGAGLFASIGSAYASQAQGYYQQAAYSMQAVENLHLTGLRADKAVEYAQLQSERRMMQTEFEVLNYKVQGNTLLRSLSKANAAARARAAANGVRLDSGSAMGVQMTNVANTYRDVGLTDLSAMVARVFGMEDATNILKAGYDTAFYEREAAIANARSLQQTGQYAAKSGGLLATATLTEGALGFAKTFPTTAAYEKAKSIFS